MGISQKVPTKIVAFAVVLAAVAVAVAVVGWFCLSQNNSVIDRDLQSLSKKPALVQVLIYGLAVFDLSELDEGYGRVLFPVVTDSSMKEKHYVRLWYGRSVSSAANEWVELKEAGGTVYIRDASIEIGGSEKQPFHLTPLELPRDGMPDQPGKATSSNWMIHASSMGQFKSFNPRAQSTELLLESGGLETCGLVHPPKYIDKVCRVKFGNSPSRAASEYMVLRFTVPYGTDSVRIITKKEDEKYFDVRPIPPASSYFDDYSAVFDIRISNLGMESPRYPETDHIEGLKPFFMGAVTPWKVAVPGCVLEDDLWNCDANCKVGYQPKCILYFSEYYPDWFPGAGGNNRPMCPFIEFP